MRVVASTLSALVDLPRLLPTIHLIMWWEERDSCGDKTQGSFPPSFLPSTVVVCCFLRRGLHEVAHRGGKEEGERGRFRSAGQSSFLLLIYIES